MLQIKLGQICFIVRANFKGLKGIHVPINNTSWSGQICSSEIESLFIDEVQNVHHGKLCKDRLTCTGFYLCVCQRVEDLEQELDKERKKNKELSSTLVRLNGIIKTGQDALSQEQKLVQQLQEQLSDKTKVCVSVTTSLWLSAAIRVFYHNTTHYLFLPFWF